MTPTTAVPAPVPLLDGFRGQTANPPIIDDQFNETITQSTINRVDDALGAFLAPLPPWLSALMGVRNLIVGRLGFETGNGRDRDIPANPGPGDQLGLFRFVDRAEDEILLGISDRRFDMRLSLAIGHESNLLTVATVAAPLDRIGRAYLTLIRPAHALVAKRMTRRIARGS